jgi:hypothetical protein
MFQIKSQVYMETPPVVLQGHTCILVALIDLIGNTYEAIFTYLLEGEEVRHRCL